MKLRQILIAFVLLSAPTLAEAGEIVRATDYDSYWLWAGVKARPEIDKARTVYLLQGEIGPDHSGAIRLKAQGGGEPGSHAATVWLAYRVRSLDWSPEIVSAVVRRYEAWRTKPGQVAGIQVDFDASTRGLANYAAFLRNLRKSLPGGCALSVTGLMDWASQASLGDIDALAGTVDEIIFQTYRGRETVQNIDAYVARLDRLHIPFRLGLAEGANWPSSDRLAGNANFRGYVVFLRNSP